MGFVSGISNLRGSGSYGSTSLDLLREIAATGDTAAAKGFADGFGSLGLNFLGLAGSVTTMFLFSLRLTDA